MTCATIDLPIAVLLLIFGIIFGVMFVIWFVCKDDRPIKDQFNDIRRMDKGIGPTEHGKIPL